MYLRDKNIDAIVLLEGGGMNCTYPLFVAASLGIPVVDADCMGRAFPRINMVTPNIYGKFKRQYAALSNGRTSVLVESDENDFESLEAKARKATVDMGGIVSLAYMPMSGENAKQWTIPGTLSNAKKIGEVMRQSKELSMNNRLEALNEVLATTDYQKADKIFKGTIVKMISSSHEFAGFNTGGFIIEDPETGKRLEVGYQNENLFAQVVSSREVLAEVPDIITIVDSNNMQVISCGEYRYGQSITVLRLSSPKMMKTERALKVVGPNAYSMEKIKGLLSNTH